jgi:hypothetical protein|tara:strand:+ start:515 stop:1123 length:609 start_codon:yes stop_codon:yes gene_type:complete
MRGISLPLKRTKKMFNEFFNIIFKSIKLDKNLYSDNSNFGEASIYFGIVIILLTSIISMIPGSVFFQHMNQSFGITGIEGPSLRSILISSFLIWIIKTSYLYFVCVVLFPGKLTKCSFRKLLITVAYANSPFLFYIFIIDIKLIYFTFIPYVLYCITLIVGLKIVLKYENYFKPTIISLAPQLLLLAYFLSSIFTINNGAVS